MSRLKSKGDGHLSTAPFMLCKHALAWDYPEKELALDHRPDTQNDEQLQTRVHCPHRLNIDREKGKENIERADDHDMHGVSIERILTQWQKEPTKC